MQRSVVWKFWKAGIYLYINQQGYCFGLSKGEMCVKIGQQIEFLLL